MHVSLWPKGLIGRVIVVILTALVLEFMGSVLIHDQVDRLTLREDHARRVAELLVVGQRLLATAPPSERQEILQSLSTQHLRVELRPAPAISSSDANPSLDRLRLQIVEWEPSLANTSLRLAATASSSPGGGRDLVGALRLDDGQWLHFWSRNTFGHWPQLYRTLTTAAILAAGVLLAAAMLVHTIGAPLRALARAADSVGHGQAVTVLETGPKDLSQVARAFNAMQARIGRLIADRSQALAAVGHDLRTPLARMRLRTGFMKEDDTRDAMEADIVEMEAMLDSVLTYLRGDGDGEQPRSLNFAALTSTLVDANADLGRPIDYSGPDELVLMTRPLSMKRAIGNLVENGLKYGTQVRVSLADRGDHARLRVEDDGPGIPEAELDRVLAPFFRLDDARGRDTAGLGLGLAIVRNAIEREAGTLILSNLPAGGLRAEIRLPLPDAAPAA
jgi:signal transduction histidine kinase